MQFTRRTMLSAMLLSPLVILGMRTGKQSEAKEQDSVGVAGHCAICDHYVWPHPNDLTAEQPAPAHCCHMSYCGDYYLYEDVIRELKLYRRPDDKCRLFSLRISNQKRSA